MVPAGTRVYAIGDIHGYDDLLSQLQERIVADAASAPSRKAVIYLGDYVDRGPHGDRVLDRLIDRPLPGFESVFLMGNHEATMLGFVEDPLSYEHWLVNGGDTTLAAYGVDWPAGGTDLEELARQARKRIPRRHLDFLRGLSFSHEEGDYFFVHAGIRPGVPLDRQSPDDMMWIRDRFLLSDLDHGKVVVHGHTPVSEPEFRANRIGVDTGVYMSGVLTCLVLEGEEQRIIQARGV